MNAEQIIEFLGTPLIDEMIVNTLSKGVSLRKSDESWVVTALTPNLDIPKMVFSYPEEELKDFGFVKVYESKNFKIFSNELLKEEIFKLIEKSEKLLEYNNMENRLVKYSYEINGVGTVLSSLFDPLPIDYLLPLFAETLSELFAVSVGVYKKSDGHYVLQSFSGLNVFEKTIEELTLSESLFIKTQSKEYALKYFSEVDGEFLIFVSGKEFEFEEETILNTIALVFKKGRELYEKGTTTNALEGVISQYNFIIQSLSEFSGKILTATDLDVLAKNIVDYIREIYQANFSAIYSGKKGFTLVSSNILKGNVPDDYDKLGKDKISEIFEMDVLDNKWIIVVGDEIIPGYLKPELREIIASIIPSEIKRAVENILYINKIKEDKEKLEFINNNISFIVSNYLNLQLKKKDEILKVFEDYTSSLLPFKIVFANLFEEAEDFESYEKITCYRDGITYGYVYFEKIRELEETELELLNLISIVLLSIIENSEIYNFDNNILEELDLIKLGKYKYYKKGNIYKPAVLDTEINDPEGMYIKIHMGEKIYSIVPEFFL